MALPMPQIEVLREQWKTFCNQFTRQHQGWIVNIKFSRHRLDAAANC
jgi:hypothetical protein